MNNQEITAMLKREMSVALGCTGPTAYALAAARCRSLLKESPEELAVYVCPAQLKIGFGVATPGTSEPGIELAAAMGALGGDYTRGFGVLETTDQETVRMAADMVHSGKVRLFCDWDQKVGIYVRVQATNRNETAEATVAGEYDNIVSAVYNGQVIFQKEIPKAVVNETEADLDPEMIFRYLEEADTRDMEFLLEGYEINKKLAEDGLNNKYALESGRSFLSSYVGQCCHEDLWKNPFEYLPEDISKRSCILVAVLSRRLDDALSGTLFAAA